VNDGCPKNMDEVHQNDKKKEDCGKRRLRRREKQKAIWDAFDMPYEEMRKENEKVPNRSRLKGTNFRK